MTLDDLQAIVADAVMGHTTSSAARSIAERLQHDDDAALVTGALLVWIFEASLYAEVERLTAVTGKSLAEKVERAAT
jgi:hypothetical protein